MSFSVILCNNNEPYLDQTMTRDEKWILYDNWWWPAQWVNQEAAPKHFPMPNLHQNEVMVTVWCSSASLIHYSFLNPDKTITSEKYAQQISEMHQKLQCLQPALVNRKSPSLLHDKGEDWLYVAQPVLQRLNEYGYKVMPRPSYSPDLSSTDYHFFKYFDTIFAGKMIPQPAGAENTFQKVCWILKHRFLWYKNEETNFSLAKMY